MRKTAPIVPHQQLVVFRLGADHFGVDVLCIQEVLRYEPITPTPQAPDFVDGILSVRGIVMPVIDLRRRFGLPDSDIDLDTRILVVDVQATLVGVVVDEVVEVRKVPESEIAEPPPFLRGLSAEYIGGVANTEESLVVILDLDRVLNSDERFALEAIDFQSTTAADSDE